MKTALTAQWIAPVSRPLIENGAIVMERGRIVDIGPEAGVLHCHADADITRLGQVLIIPGLVNAHTHLELSDFSRESLLPAGAISRRPGGPTLPGGFVNWLREMIVRTLADSRDPAERCASATRHGIAQCLRFGVTCVGDITTQPAATRAVLARSALRGVSFGEIRAMGGKRSLIEERIEQATDSENAGAMAIGLSPHAPYSVEIPGYARCLAVARERGIPLATHLAENPAEAEFLEHQTGPFRELWKALPWWDDSIPRFAGGSIRMAHSLGLLDFPAVLAHVNCCDDAELELLARGRASVVYCPRTSTWFGHPPHRFREMLARNVNVALGTDSCASSPDLNLLEEARLVHRLAPDIPPEMLLRMITLHGARALNHKDIGTLEPGKYADMVILAVTSQKPLWEIMEVPILPERVLIAGRVPGE